MNMLDIENKEIKLSYYGYNLIYKHFEENIDLSNLYYNPNHNFNLLDSKEELIKSVIDEIEKYIDFSKNKIILGQLIKNKNFSSIDLTPNMFSI